MGAWSSGCSGGGDLAILLRGRGQVHMALRCVSDALASVPKGASSRTWPWELPETLQGSQRHVPRTRKPHQA